MTYTTEPKNKPNKPMEKRIANSMLFPIEQTLNVDSLFDGKLVHLSFDCPTNLREALNAETKANNTSTCKVLQYLASVYVVKSRIQRHALGNTFSKVLDGKFSIGEMNFTQYVQTRPRRLIRKIETERVKETVTKTEETVDYVAPKVTDWHSLSFEDLQARYNGAELSGDTTVKVMCLAEAKLRGVSLG